MTNTPSSPESTTLTLIVTGHPAAPRTTELALALAHGSRSVRVLLAPGAENFAPLPAWTNLESLLQLPAKPLTSAPGNSLEPAVSGTNPLVVAPAPLDLLGRIRAADIRDPIVAAVLDHAGPVYLVPPCDPSADGHPVATDLRMALEKAGFRICPSQISTPQGMLPPPDAVLNWMGQPATNSPAKSPTAAAAAAPEQSTPASGTCSDFWPHLPPWPTPGPEAPWTDRTILITGGPTREMLDPVHAFTTLGNGHLAWHLAVEARNLGATIILVLGPVAYRPPQAPGLTVLHATTTEDMLALAQSRIADASAFLFADDASVVRSEKPYAVPVFRSGNSVALRLVETPDLAQALAFRANPNQIVAAVQLTPLAEGAQPGQLLLRRRLRALAVLDRHAQLEAEAQSEQIQHPTNSPKFAPLSPEDHFLGRGSMIRIHTQTGGSILPSGQTPRLLQALLGSEIPPI